MLQTLYLVETFVSWVTQGQINRGTSYVCLKGQTENISWNVDFDVSIMIEKYKNLLTSNL